MSAFEESFREEAQRVRISPSASAWKRLEARLETQRVRRSARISRIISYAAGVTLLIGLSIGSFYFLNQPVLLQRDGYSATIVELEAPDTQGQSIYNVEKVRALSATLLAHNRSGD